MIFYKPLGEQKNSRTGSRITELPCPLAARPGLLSLQTVLGLSSLQAVSASVRHTVGPDALIFALTF